MTWSAVPLRDLIAEPLANGRSVPDRAGGFPVLRLTALRNGSVDLREHKEGAWSRSDAERFLVKAGDFLVSRGNGSLDLVGRGGLVVVDPEPVAFPDTMIRVRPDTQRLEPRYLALAWNGPAVRAQIEGAARTTAGIYKVNQGHLGSVTLPLPPLDEQRRIVDVLEDHLSRLDAADNYLATGRRKLDALEQVALAGCREGELRPLAEVTVIQGGIQKQPKRAPKDNAFPFLRVANVTAHGLDLSEIHEVELFDGELDRLRLQPGDLLVVEGNGSASQIGRAALWDASIADCVHQNHLIRVRPLEGLTPLYLEAVWNSPQNRAVLTDVASSSSGLHTLSVSKLKALSIPVPTVETQRDLVARVDEIRAAKGRLVAEIEAAASRRIALQRSLLAAAFSGRLMSQTDVSDVEEMIGI